MIEKLSLKFGKAPGSPPLSLDLTPITVFVGPNNSGKSKLLTEINQFCCTGQVNNQNVILEQVQFSALSTDEVKEGLRRVTLDPLPHEAVKPNHIFIGNGNHRFQIVEEALVNALLNTNEQLVTFCQWYLRFNTMMLDGQSRIGLVGDQSAGDLQQPSTSSFQTLFKDDALRAKLRQIVHEAFGYFLTVDATSLGTLRLRLSAQAPSSNLEECGIHKEAIEFQKRALPIDQASDGVKAFTGILTAILASDPHLLLIDEPEAFLHPSLAFKLGYEIARASTTSNKRLFVSTHSPNFVMGCIQSGAPVNIVRLTYRSGSATARLLSNQNILSLMRNPLLRSTGVISGLFFESVVVTEADSDRAFYEEVNERLLRLKPDRGIPNCLFLNAQNKQTIQTIIQPLRALGIPAAGIVDIDILKEGGAVWSNFLISASVPEIERNSLAIARSNLKQRFDATGKNMKRDGGIDLLNSDDHEAARNLFERLSEYGLFVVQGGELESWLKGLQASNHGPSWLIEVFEKMGEDPLDSGYLKPTDDDVWAFLGSVKQWLGDSIRKGIP